MKKLLIVAAAAGLAASALAGLYGDTPDARHAWAVHDRNRPNPVKVTAEPGLPPSDAIILFDGSEKSFANWCSMKMEPTKWKLVDGTLESVKGAGYIRTRAEYGGDFQLHVEWATPVRVEGVGRRRGGLGGDLDGVLPVAVVDGPGVRGVGDVAIESGESRRGEAGGGSGNHQFLHKRFLV